MSVSVRVRRADATPHAASLIEGLRDIGYSLETALADIIDNSITAEAHNVWLLSETVGDDPTIALLDDGVGMSEDELVAAMRPGSQNPLASRSAPDLGRFGLGLKSSSFSQCRRLTVVSRKDGKTSAAVWDLDEVADRNSWEIVLPDDPSTIPFADRIDEKGTLVLWQKLDRLTGGIVHDVDRRTEVINARLAGSERHLRLVFHRFMEQKSGLNIWLNGRKIAPLDPFVLKNKGGIAGPEETLELPHGNVVIQSFTIPHHRQMRPVQWDDLGGPEGHLKSQGFYVYRGNRLIIHGTWFGLMRQSELTKLSRVRIDIPNSMDADWKIDVKKSSAQLPPMVRDRLKQVIERITDGSKRTYRKKGQKLVDKERLPFWHRVQADGKISYRPNLDHPAFSSYAESLPEDLRHGFLNCISLIGASLPIETLHADMAGMPEQIVVERVDEDTLVQAVRATLTLMRAAGKDLKEITAMMKEVDPFRSAWEDTQRIIDDVLAVEQGN